ncbi:MAG TPA: hypothetical protein VHS80_06645 [Chthoniobacterales bacterium]|jgi:hypothetical protein|nr:hypothetical protein [Chthoniobacterales bacterium]
MNKTELIQIIRRAADERSERLELQNQEITSIPEEIGLLTDLKVPPNRTPTAERAIQEASAKKTPQPPPVKEPEPEPRPESLHLENNEAVTMGELARFIGRSPRATKRFVNVYRLIKAALPADEIDAFVGSASAPGPFRGVMLLLALVTGVPTLSLAALRRINHPAGDTSFWQIIDAIRNDPSIAPHDEWERLDGFLTADTDSR